MTRSRVEVERAGPPVVLRVRRPPGGWALLLLALFWNAIAVPSAFLAWRDGRPAAVLLGAAFAAVGVLLTLAFLHWLLVATRVVAGPGRAAVRRSMCGVRWTRGAELPADARAVVQEPFTAPDESRPRVRVGGESGPGLTFGTDLPEADLRRAAAAINAALGVSDPAAVGPPLRDVTPPGPPRWRSLSDTSRSDAETPPLLAPAAAAAGLEIPHVRTGRDARGRATVTVPLLPGRTVGVRVLVWFGAEFCGLWWSLIVLQVAEEVAAARVDGDWSRVLFLLPFAGAGAAGVVGVRSVRRVTVRTAVGDRSVEVMWGLGDLGFPRAVPIARVADVVVWENPRTTAIAAGDRRDPVAALWVRVPHGSPRPVALSFGGGRPVAEAVAGAVRDRLEAGGWEPTPPPA